MIQGLFINDNIPIVQITVASGSAVQTPYVIVDTGFTGDLLVTPKIADDLGFTIDGTMPVQLADGKVSQVPVAVAIGVMEGVTDLITVLISKGSPLVGISFLSKFSYKASIDCKHKTVQLERV